jgi:hypothetical protein
VEVPMAVHRRLLPVLALLALFAFPADLEAG